MIEVSRKQARSKNHSDSGFLLPHCEQWITDQRPVTSTLLVSLMPAQHLKHNKYSWNVCPVSK